MVKDFSLYDALRRMNPSNKDLERIGNLPDDSFLQAMIEQNAIFGGVFAEIPSVLKARGCRDHASAMITIAKKSLTHYCKVPMDEANSENILKDYLYYQKQFVMPLPTASNRAKQELYHHYKRIFLCFDIIFLCTPLSDYAPHIVDQKDWKYMTWHYDDDELKEISGARRYLLNRDMGLIV